MKTILFAFQDQQMSRILDALKSTKHKLTTITSTNEELPSYSIDIAIIDETFDGKNSGWKMASRIRDIQKTTKILMVVHEKDIHKYSRAEFQPYYDWIMLRSTVSIEQILSEIERSWDPK